MPWGDYSPHEEYEAGMAGSSLKEQTQRNLARRETDPERRKYREEQARQAHSEMQVAAGGGMDARRAERKRQTAKR